MTVTIGLKSELTFPAMLAFLLSGCTGESVAKPGSEQATTDEASTTEEPVPTTGHDAPEVSSSEPSATSSTAMDETTTGTASTTADEPLCGDGVVEGSEQCDDGFKANLLTAECLPNCVFASCGDGFVQAGVEECDPGDVEEVEYGGCLPVTCKWGPRCGDGHVDVPHEVCDPGDPNGQDDAAVGCDAGCRFEGRIVFLTSDEYSGNLGGLDGADGLCRTLAASFDEDHASNYVAWLSDVDVPASERIKKLDVPYVLRSGVQVAENYADLVVHGPAPGITLTEKYETVEVVQVWTGTGGSGELYEDLDPCARWTSDSEHDFARVGLNWWPAADDAFGEWQEEHHWTSRSFRTCDVERRLYCLEN